MNTFKHGDKITRDRDTWKVIGVGAEENGRTFLHLASTTRGRQTKAGWYPVQSCVWVCNTCAGGPHLVRTNTTAA